MKNKKMIVNVVMILIAILAIIALLIYDNIQQKEGLESGNSDISLVEEITPLDTVSQTESKVPPISSEDSSEQEEANEKAEVEFDIGDYKPIPKDPTVEDVTIEYETKEAEINE